jgi:hypothetical protein
VDHKLGSFETMVIVKGLASVGGGLEAWWPWIDQGRFELTYICKSLCKATANSIMRHLFGSPKLRNFEAVWTLSCLLLQGKCERHIANIVWEKTTGENGGKHGSPLETQSLTTGDEQTPRTCDTGHWPLQWRLPAWVLSTLQLRAFPDQINL